MNLTTRAAVSLLPVALAASVAGQQSPAIRFTETTLANGLRVIVSEDRSAPVVSVLVHYDVGSRDERKGRTGFAHLFEHMMFKGSTSVGDGEHHQLVVSVGGMLNAMTNKDRTVYFQTLPSNQLDLAIFLEADRMRSLDISQATLDNQRHAVQEERRRNLDNQAYGRTNDALSGLVYDNTAYGHPTIGSMEDLDASTVEDVREFFKTYYAPNNAVLVIVGDVDTKVAVEKVRRAFEAIPAQPAPPRADLTEPKQTAERRKTFEDPLARLTRLDIVYKVPPRFSADDEAVIALATVLGSGRSSRLYQRLQRDLQLVSSVMAARDNAIGPGMLRIVATVAPGKAPEDVERAIGEEIEKLKTTAPEDWEVEKAINDWRRDIVAETTDSLQRAVQLATYAVAGETRRINDRLVRVQAVTAADLQRVAATYLRPENRTVVTTVPARRGPKEGQ